MFVPFYTLQLVGYGLLVGESVSELCMYMELLILKYDLLTRIPQGVS